MKVILGSGIVGLLAKTILGPEWKIIPFGKSRLYSFKVPLADNIFIHDPKLDHFISSELKLISSILYPYYSCYSVQGQIVKAYDPALTEAWLHKVYGEQYPTQAKPYYAHRMNNMVYGARVTELYAQLLSTYMDELRRESNAGQVTDITHNIIKRGDEVIQFEKAVSTIPLNALLELYKVPHTLQANDVYIYYVHAPDIDIEGSNQCYVIDKEIQFYKATRISADHRYLFYSTTEIEFPGLYFKQFSPKSTILDYTKIPQGLPIGEKPNLSLLESQNMYCVGSYAEWDDCRDVSSCILRLLSIAGKITA